MDRDEKSIGGVKHPLQPTKQLFYTTIVLDILAIISSLFVSSLYAGCIAVYIIFSRLYSYRKVRLKQFPIIGYLTVIINQGSLTFFMVHHGSDENFTTHVPLLAIIAAALLIGGFYPITQIYQHEEDERDGVTSISMLLGKKGTFVFCAIIYSMAVGILGLYYNNHEQIVLFLVLLVFFIPVVFYFIRWFLQVLKDSSMADFTHTMKLNMLASTCTSLAFITIILLQKLWLK